ncbi:MAG: alpha/beta hydrolase domain-containing protein [Acidimicrobiia bacterium]
MTASSASVSGPITGGVKGRPFSLPEADLAARGYVAEEFFLEGTATSYATAPGAEFGMDGRWDAVEDGTADFRTRILVVRPADPARCNGTAVVHWLNVTAGYEKGTADDEELLSGYVWVGVSAQKVGIDGRPSDVPTPPGRSLPEDPLKVWDPERYGSLVHPGDEFSFDMLSQTSKAVRSGAVTGGVVVDRLVATGASQSGARLATYLNAVHPLVHVYDAFMPTITIGSGTSLQGAPPNAALDTGTWMPTRVRGDSDEPVMIVNSEFEVEMMASSRQADSDRFRFWEVAGTPHTQALAPPPEPHPEGRTDNPLSHRPVLSAAYAAMHRWLTDGTEPPTFPTVELGADGSIVRDEHGNALGGIRLPELVAPVAEYHGRDHGAPGLLMLYGWARPFSRDELRGLHASHDAYVDAYRRGTDELVAAGGLRPEDVAARHDDAEKVAAGLDL